MFFKYKYMCAVLVIQMKFSELLEYASFAGRMEASYTVMWLIFQLLITIPICVSQFLIGQYGKMLQIRTWEILPLIFGIGFSMLLMSLLYMTCESQISIMAVEYVLVSFSKKLPWCDCKFQEGSGCLDVPEKALFFERALDSKPRGTSNETFNTYSERLNLGDSLREKWQMRAESNEISSFNYFKHQEVEMRHKYVWIRIVVILIFWCAVFAAGIMKFSLYVKIVPCALLIMGALFIAGYIFIFLQYNVIWAIDQLSIMKTEYFIRIQAWNHAAFTSAKTLIVGTGSMIFFGSFLVGNARPDINAVFLSITKIFLCILMSIFFVNIFQYEETRYDVSDMNQRQIIAGKRQLLYAGPLLLAFLCHLPISNISAIICFTLIAIFQYMVVVLEMSIIVTCIYESFVKVQRYRLYLLGGICFLMLTAELIKLLENGTEIIEMLYDVKRESSVIIAMLYTFFVHILYGPIRLANDMELMIKSKIPQFWIALWIFSFVLTLITIPSLDHSLKTHPRFTIMHGMLVVLIILPIIIAAIILYFRYLKNHVLFNLIRPTRKWRPKDYDQEALDIYDFRKKIRYKIPYKVCEHPCLNNAVLLNNEERAIASKRESLLEENRE